MDAPKPSAEREQTDASLREEREKADRAIAEGRDLVQESADDVLRRARAEADSVLEEARRKADHVRRDTAGTVSATLAVELERRFEDDTVQAERDTADHTLELERVETARLLARLLPLERDRTDDRLHDERLRADGALAHRDDFLGLVAHDLRDLVGGIVISSAVIGRIAVDIEHAARIGAEVTRIQRHALRATRLIRDLVDIASIDAGRLSIVKAPGDLRALLADAVDERRPAAAAKGIALDVEGHGGPLPASFDYPRLLQAMDNLLANAIKFTPGQGRIVVRAERVHDEVCCSVADTGPGVPGDQLERIFERFVQVYGDDRRGLGLGLFITKQIVEGHAGRIWAESAPGQGATMRFTIPAQVP